MTVYSDQRTEVLCSTEQMSSESFYILDTVGLAQMPKHSPVLKNVQISGPS